MIALIVYDTSYTKYYKITLPLALSQQEMSQILLEIPQFASDIQPCVETKHFNCCMVALPSFFGKKPECLDFGL